MLARLKFNIDTLVNDILDAIPQDILINGIVLDPAMGGGQFIKEVEKRKMAAGKTDAEIASTVYGIEENILRRDYAVNKHKLAGTYTVEDFLNKDFKDMKFDVIVGNPPYDSFGQNDQIKLWNVITLKSLELVKDNGFIAFTTPQTILAGTDATIKADKPTYRIQKKFEENSLIVYDETSNDNFDVGVPICSWVYQHTPNQGIDTKFIFEDGTLISAKYIAAKKIYMNMKDSIIDQFTKSSHPKYIRNRIVQERADLSTTVTAIHTVPVIWNAKGLDLLYSTKKYDTSYKLCINNYKRFKLSNENLIITTDDVSPSYFYITGSFESLNKMQTLWNTKKIFQYVGNNFLNTKGVFLIAQRQSVIPMLELGRDWTDEELYDEFELTDEQRAAVEEWCVGNI